MEWSKGYSATYYAARVDPVTWRDVERFEIVGGTVKRDSDALRESADIKCIGHQIEVEQWIRVYLDARQSGDASHVALFTGIASTPDLDRQMSRPETDLACYSVLKPVDDVLLPRGWYASAGRTGGDVLKELFSATPAPVIIADGSPRLTESIIAEDGETRLTMVDRVLEAIDWRLRINGDGTIEAGPKPMEASVTFDPIENDVLEPDVQITADWYACPNVFMAVADDLTGIARDESDGPLSINGRGREVWAYESSADLADNENIGQYAMRKLKELQQVAKQISYARRYYPDVVPGDLIRLHYADIEGLYTVQGQSIELSYNARTSEDVVGTSVGLERAERSDNVNIIRIVDNNNDYLVTADDDYIVGIAVERS